MGEEIAQLDEGAPLALGLGQAPPVVGQFGATQDHEEPCEELHEIGHGPKPLDGMRLLPVLELGRKEDRRQEGRRSAGLAGNRRGSSGGPSFGCSGPKGRKGAAAGLALIVHHRVAIAALLGDFVLLFLAAALQAGWAA